MARILTVEEAAQKLRISTKTARRMLRMRELPGRKVGRAWRVLETDVELWVRGGGTERGGEFVSARGLLRKYPGGLTSEEVNAAKRMEAELEEAKLARRGDTEISA